MTIFLLFISLLIIQRLSELLLARRNERAVRAMGAREYDSGGYRTIVLMHAAFFVSLAAEFFLLLAHLPVSRSHSPLQRLSWAWSESTADCM